MDVCAWYTGAARTFTLTRREGRVACATHARFFLHTRVGRAFPSTLLTEPWVMIAWPLPRCVGACAPRCQASISRGFPAISPALGMDRARLEQMQSGQGRRHTGHRIKGSRRDLHPPRSVHEGTLNRRADRVLPETTSCRLPPGHRR